MLGAPLAHVCGEGVGVGVVVCPLNKYSTKGDRSSEIEVGVGVGEKVVKGVDVTVGVLVGVGV